MNELEKLLKLKANKLGSKLNKNYYDLAAASQKCFEDIYLNLINQIKKINRSNNLVISGGCGLNSLVNGKFYPDLF